MSVIRPNSPKLILDISHNQMEATYHHHHQNNNNNNNNSINHGMKMIKIEQQSESDNSICESGIPMENYDQQHYITNSEDLNLPRSDILSTNNMAHVGMRGRKRKQPEVDIDYEFDAGSLSPGFCEKKLKYENEYPVYVQSNEQYQEYKPIYMNGHIAQQVYPVFTQQHQHHHNDQHHMQQHNSNQHQQNQLHSPEMNYAPSDIYAEEIDPKMEICDKKPKKRSYTRKNGSNKHQNENGEKTRKHKRRSSKASSYEDMQNQRVMANVRERQRTQSLNEAFSSLRKIIPTLPILSNNELALLEEKANLIPHTEMGTHFTSSGILAHESLSYLFRVWRMDGEWNSCANTDDKCTDNNILT
uniref:CSON014809 protein n=1 Tax=Culicoides sonorensis TaxID=179676 RepID=A0A336MPA0_CULSO